uniref:Uncharacterized protein n=1 Tax=Arundo donax TaxID=35708 RepID=A0A0A9H328_ARUDO
MYGTYEGVTLSGKPSGTTYDLIKDIISSMGGSGDWSGTALKEAPTDALPLAFTAAPGLGPSTT